MWSTGIVMFLCMNQNSFSTLQAKSMDRHITKNFEIPAGSFTVFMVVTLTIWVAFYDRVMVPLLVKYTGRPKGLNTKVRMGIGLLLACAALAVAADKDKRIKRRNERGRQIWIHDGRRYHECPERRSRWTEETCKADGAEAEGPRS